MQSVITQNNKPNTQANRYIDDFDDDFESTDRHNKNNQLDDSWDGEF